MYGWNCSAPSRIQTRPRTICTTRVDVMTRPESGLDQFGVAHWFTGWSAVAHAAPDSFVMKAPRPFSQSRGDSTKRRRSRSGRVRLGMDPDHLRQSGESFDCGRSAAHASLGAASGGVHTMLGFSRAKSMARWTSFGTSCLRRSSRAQPVAPANYPVTMESDRVRSTHHLTPVAGAVPSVTVIFNSAGISVHAPCAAVTGPGYPTSPVAPGDPRT